MSTGFETWAGGSLRALEFSYPDIAHNLALDEALLISAEEQGFGPSLRVWEQLDLAAVLGASCRLRDDLDVERCGADGVVIARRSSGGGTVLLGRGALNVAVVLPIAADPRLVAVDTAQAYVLSRIAEAIRAMRVGVTVEGSGDLALDGRKVCGSAQRRLKRHLLVHATILYALPLAAISDYLRNPKRQPAYRAERPHAEFVANLPLARDVLVHAIHTAWGAARATTADVVGIPSAIVDELVSTKFADKAWTERL